MGREYSRLTVARRWNGMWAVMREIKGKQPIILCEGPDEQKIRDKKRELEPAKRKKKRFKYPPLT